MEWRAAQFNSLRFAHALIGCVERTGVKLSTVLEECGISKGASWPKQPTALT
jgi:sulfane dehydrogenase subunit SoxC